MAKLSQMLQEKRTKSFKKTCKKQFLPGKTGMADAVTILKKEACESSVGRHSPLVRGTGRNVVRMEMPKKASEATELKRHPEENIAKRQGGELSENNLWEERKKRGEYDRLAEAVRSTILNGCTWKKKNKTGSYADGGTTKGKVPRESMCSRG